MSSIWTPDGERPVGRPTSGSPSRGSEPPEGRPRPPAGFDEPPRQGARRDDGGSAGPGPGPGPAELDELRRQLAETPADVVVANHCFGLFELAALHMSLEPPKLSEAQLAIDALAAVVENLTGRLGDAEPHLREGLSQLRMAFVQVRQRAER